MQAQHSALNTTATRATVQHWPFGTHPASTDYLSIRGNADCLCVLVNLACLVFAVIVGLIYNNAGQAVAWGVPLFATSLLASRLYAGQTTTMHLNAAMLVGMGALHVHLAGGLLEYHFSFFLLLPVMLAYRDIRPVISMGLFIVMHHFVFGMLQHTGWPAVALHSMYVALEVVVLSAIAQTLRQHAIAAEEGAKLLSYLDKEKGINLRVRAQTDEQGRMSPMGQVFNDYADNMAFVVAAFKMLRTDIRELSQIAKELGADNHQQMEDSTQASKKLRDFVQNLGMQTRMGQSTAELSKKTTEDCFDLLNELNQSLEHLQKISKQAFESNQQIQLLQKEIQSHANHTANQHLNATLSALDHLNERTNAFMAKMDVLKSGLSAIENQAVSIDRATHQWVENGHGNQRQGWEVLGAMEGMQSRSENAFRTLGSTVQTILRADELMREMEKRLARFDV
jgi:methyl-accepting chemotaxis protein